MGALSLTVSGTDSHLIFVATALMKKDFLTHAWNYVSRVKNIKDLHPRDGMAYNLVLGEINRRDFRKYGLAKKYYEKAVSLGNGIIINDEDTSQFLMHMFRYAHLGLKKIYEYYEDREEVLKQEQILLKLENI